jgi:hypothetical protein
MPIIKRRSIPNVNVQRGTAGRRLDPYELPGRPLVDILKEYDKQASDAAWAEKHDEAAIWQAKAATLRVRIEAGELYEVSGECR